MYGSVLVALDGSEQAARAVPHGLAMARQFGVLLILLRVVPPVDDTEAGGSISDVAHPEKKPDVLLRREYDSRRSQAEGYLQGLARALRGNGVGIEVRLAEGAPADVIMETARSLPHPLIVMTPNGRTAGMIRDGIGRPGSVADAVLRGASLPILVVCSDYERTTSGGR